MLWQEDADRDNALSKVAGKAAWLEKVPSVYRRDQDVALAAVANDAEAWKLVCLSLRSNRDWVVEAAWRNWEVLQHMPKKYRSDPDVVLAAAWQDEAAFRFAGPGLADDPCLRAALEADDAAPRYRGECLRLVGDFNRWRTTDAAVRLMRLPPEVKDSELPGGADQSADPGEAMSPVEFAASVSRHRLDIYLMDGWISFQVLSCIWGFELRIYPHPSALSAKDPCRMQPGDHSAVPAVVGGTADGRDACFLIQERQNSVVSVYVELSAPSRGLGGSGACQARVWYEAGRRASQCSGLINVRTRHLQVVSRRWVPQFMPTAARRPRPPRPKPREPSPEVDASALGGAPPGTALLLGVERGPEPRPLLEQVLAMSARTFEPQDVIIGVPAGYRLALLVDEAEERMLAYCLYVRRPKDGALHVHQLAVLESHRGAGLGSWLMRWAAAVASRAKLRSVRLASTPDARAFYRSCGFRDDAVRGRTTPLAHPMELTVTPAATAGSVDAPPSAGQAAPGDGGAT